MALDTIIHNGDNLMGSAGDYETTETTAGMMMRCHNAWFGKWPAGKASGVEFGNSMWEEMPAKWSETSKERIKSKIKQAQQPLVDMGRIKDVTVTELYSSREDAPRLRIRAYDIATQDYTSIDVERPWGL